MGFLKKRRETLFFAAFSVYMVLQSMALHYKMNRFSTEEVAENDTMASFEINQLEELWVKADVGDLVTLEKMSNPKELELARIRLKKAEAGIQESKNRVKEVTGKRYEFFQKAHAYYVHSASALLGIVDFLLANEGGYSITEDSHEISFEEESDNERFQELLGQLSLIHQEKQELNAAIAEHNHKVEKKPL